MSIRAMNWAMDQATGDPRSQCLLYVIADCASPDGVAWPSIKYMAAKSQQSKATVQRRLKELEEIGAVARFPRWEDEDGKVNSEGRGRRTSDEIRLLLDRSIVIRNDDEGTEESAAPPSQADTGGLQADTGPVAQLSDGPPSHCGDPYMNRNSEPEDSPPNPPSGGDATQIEIEGWQDFKSAFESDGDPIVRVSLAQQLFAALKPDERSRVTLSAKGLIAWRHRQKKPPSKPSAQTFIREIGAWATWEKHAPPDPVACEPPIFVAEDSEDWQALRVLAAIRNEPELRALALDHGRGLMLKALRPAVKALAQFAGDQIDTSAWKIFEEGTQQCGAWCEFARMRPHNVDTGETRVMQVGSKIYNDWQVKVVGVRVPCEWPPRKDGTLSTAGPKHESNLTEDDMKQQL